MKNVNKIDIASLLIMGTVIEKSIEKTIGAEHITDEIKQKCVTITISLLCGDHDIRCTNMTDAIVKLVKNDKVPKIEFKKGTPFYDEAIHISLQGAMVASADTMVENTKRWLSEIDLNMESVNELIDTVSTSFAENLTNANDTLGQLTETAEGLMTGITKIIEDRSLSNEAILSATRMSNCEYSYDEFNWDVLKLPGSKMSIIDSITSEIVKTPNITEQQKFQVCTAKYIARKTASLMLSDINFDSEFKESTINNVSADDDITADQVRATYNVMVNSIRLNAMRSRAVKILTDYRSDPSGSIIWFTEFIATNYNACKKLETSLLSNTTEPDEISAINNAVSVITAIAEIGAYFVHYLRDTMFADTVLFPFGMINPDTKDKASKAGIDAKDIGLYIEYVLDGMAIPRVGVTLSRLIEKKESTIKHHNDIEYTTKIHAEVASKRIKRKSLIERLNSYVLNTIGDDKVIDIGKRANAVVTTSVPMIDVVYECLIEYMHDDTLVELMFKELGQGYVKLVSENAQISESMLAAANVEVYTSIITKFIKKEFIV